MIFLFIYEDVIHITMLKKWKKYFNKNLRHPKNLKKRLILFSQLILQSFSNFSSPCSVHTDKQNIILFQKPICILIQSYLFNCHQQQKNYFYQLQMLFGFSSTNDLIWVIYNEMSNCF